MVVERLLMPDRSDVNSTHADKQLAPAGHGKNDKSASTQTGIGFCLVLVAEQDLRQGHVNMAKRRIPGS